MMVLGLFHMSGVTARFRLVTFGQDNQNVVPVQQLENATPFGVCPSSISAVRSRNSTRTF